MKGKRKLLWFVGIPLVLALMAGGVFWEHPISCFNQITYLRESLAGVENRSVQVDGHRVHYVAEGPANGPVVVLVHGLGGRAEDWIKLAPYLAKAGYRVYLPDLLGYGRSEKPADFSYAVHDEAAFVVQFIDALGLKQVDLGGWSMGGGIVQHVAFTHPERVRRLMLFDAVGLNIKPTWDVRLFTPTSAQQLEELDALLMPNPPRIPSFLVRDILRVSDERAWVIHRAINAMLNGQDATDKILPQLKMPVLLVWGAVDRIIPLSQAEAMHRLVPQSRLEVIDACGHLAPGQCSAQIGPKVVDFLK